MSTYLMANQLAEQRHRELTREAAAWRRGREARRSAIAQRAIESVAADDGAVFCKRAAARAARCAA